MLFYKHNRKNKAESNKYYNISAVIGKKLVNKYPQKIDDIIKYKDGYTKWILKEYKKRVNNSTSSNWIQQLKNNYNKKGCSVYYSLTPTKKKIIKKKKVKKNIQLQAMYSCGSSRNFDFAYQAASSIWPYIGDNNFHVYWRGVTKSYSSVANCFIEKPKIRNLTNQKRVHTTNAGISIYISESRTNNAIYVYRQVK